MSRRQRILDAALACFLELGYERTTVARIAERSGVSNGAVFHHFATKEAIAGALQVDALRSFQEGHHELLRRRPRSLRAAVRGTIAHQVEWTEANVDLARFLYRQGHLDPESAAGRELAELNRSLAAAYREWMEPFVQAGEIRPMAMVMLTAIVTGPAHAVAQRWLAGQLPGALTDYAPELIDAAVAGVRGAPVRSRGARAPAPETARARIELLSADGDVLAGVETDLNPGGPARSRQ